MKLPIDVVPDSRPLSFRWQQVVHTPWGIAVQECEGPLSPSCEQAVADLVALAKQQAIEIECKGQVLVEKNAELDRLEAELTKYKESEKPIPEPVDMPSSDTVGKSKKLR